jgi:hypothetical protein
MTPTTTFETLVEKTKDEIIDTVNAKGIYRCATCNAPNWDRNLHEAHHALKRQGIAGLNISVKVNFEVTDWTITK